MTCRPDGGSCMALAIRAAVEIKAAAAAAGI
jgi:hypothetical protein